jgi:hypothetical protein
MVKVKLIKKIKAFLTKKIIYDYQRTLLKLTGVMLVATFFVVRGSTIPLVMDSKIVYWLFYSEPAGDKTLYSIGISVIAAYLFYLIQVYIPEKTKTKKQILSFSIVHRHAIYLLNQYVLAWEKFLEEKGRCKFQNFEYKLNYKMTGVITKEIYEETIDELFVCLNKVIDNPEFNDCDSKYKEFILKSKYKIEGHLKFMDDQFPRWNNETLLANDYEFILSLINELKDIQLKLSYIEKYYLEVLEIRPYGGKSQVQKMAESL